MRHERDDLRLKGVYRFLALLAVPKKILYQLLFSLKPEAPTVAWALQKSLACACY